MKYGLAETDLKLLFDKIVDPLKKHNAQVFIFGSRATGKFAKFSDVDLLYVQAPHEIIPGYKIHLILTDLENSHFPYKVDLVNYDELAVSYKANVDREKVEL